MNYKNVYFFIVHFLCVEKPIIYEFNTKNVWLSRKYLYKYFLIYLKGATIKTYTFMESV